MLVYSRFKNTILCFNVAHHQHVYNIKFDISCSLGLTSYRNANWHLNEWDSDESMITIRKKRKKLADMSDVCYCFFEGDEEK